MKIVRILAIIALAVVLVGCGNRRHQPCPAYGSIEVIESVNQA